MNKKKPGRKPKKPNKAIFEMMYCNMTAKELAKHYEVTEQTIFNWAAKFRKENEQ